mmetsp:Transcript_21344/g.61214  ORF Transcript_21344/g.61214 Transcript_21344/m.61214 type:complete len:353 (-) Transcript_21344:15-1073(-)
MIGPKSGNAVRNPRVGNESMRRNDAQICVKVKAVHVVAQGWIRGDAADGNVGRHRKGRAVVDRGRIGIERAADHPRDVMSSRYAGAAIGLNSDRRGRDSGGIACVSHDLSRRKGQHGTNAHPMRCSGRVGRFHGAINHGGVRGTVGMRRRSSCRRGRRRSRSGSIHSETNVRPRTVHGRRYRVQHGRLGLGMGRIGTVQTAIGHVVDGDVRAVGADAPADVRRTTSKAYRVRSGVDRRRSGVEGHRRDWSRLHMRLELPGGKVRAAPAAAGVGIDGRLVVVATADGFRAFVPVVPAAIGSSVLISTVTALLVAWISIAAVSTTSVGIVFVCWDVGIHLVPSFVSTVLFTSLD